MLPVMQWMRLPDHFTMHFFTTKTTSDKARSSRWIGLCLLLAACLVGCCGRQPEAPESTERQMEAASKALTEGRYENAVTLYRQVVRHDPDNALAHFELALLLQDNREDDLLAYHHFTHYLELEPESDKAPIARQRLEAIKEKNSKRTAGSTTSARVVSDTELVQHIEELNKTIRKHETTIAEKQEEIGLLKAENDRLGKEVAGLSQRIELMLNSGSTTPRRPSPEIEKETLIVAAPTQPQQPVRPLPIPPTARKYRVKRGDSLWSIAQTVYGDASRMKDIRNANRDRVGPNDRLTEGTDLLIPMP